MYYSQFSYMYIMIIKIILLIFVLLMILWFALFAIILLLWPMITGFKKAPYVPSFDCHLSIMKRYLQLNKWSKIIDLGCGDGKVLRFFSKEFWLFCTWYDVNPLVIWYGKFSNRLLWYRDIVLIRSNFNKAPLHHYDYIYIYLWPEQLVSIEDWMFQNIWKNTIIISNSFTFAQHIPFDILYDSHNKKVIYLYKK